MRKLLVPAVFAIASFGFATSAAAETSPQASPRACFGAFASNFAINNPKSGQDVSAIATSGPGAIGGPTSTTATSCPPPQH
jgi:hypothetical protein